MKVTNKAPLMAQNLATIQKYLRRGLLGQVLLACLFISNAWAIDEICGDGLDDASSGYTKGSCPTGWMDAVYGDGCDLKCPTPDQDADGYVTSGTKISDVQDALGLDCDDTDRTIYAGIYTTKGCNSGYYRKCQDDGTYTSCTNTPPCEATGSGACHYFDPVNGNDTTGDGSYAYPWKTLAKLNVDSGVNHAVVAGDAYYLLDGADYTYNTNNSAVRLNSTARCSAAAPCIIANYPGHRPVINPSGAVPGTNEIRGINFYSTYYWSVRGIEIKNTTSDAIRVDNESHDIIIKDNVLHDVDGISANNIGAIYVVDTPYNININHNAIYSIVDTTSTSNVWTSAVMFMYGYDNKSSYNVIAKGSKDGNLTNYGGLFAKYGTTTGGWEIIGNIGISLDRCWGGTQSSMNIRHNRCIEFTESCYNFGRYSIYNYFRNNAFEYNLCTGSGNMVYGYGTDAEIDQSPTNNTTSNNIFVSTAPNTNEYSETVSMFIYASAADTLPYVTALVFSDNCYYNTNSVYRWKFSSSYNYTTLASWQSGLSQDANSYIENPSLDTYQIGTSTNCADKGWRTALTGSGSSSSSSSSISVQGRSRQACLLN